MTVEEELTQTTKYSIGKKYVLLDTPWVSKSGKVYDSLLEIEGSISADDLDTGFARFTNDVHREMESLNLNESASYSFEWTADVKKYETIQKFKLFYNKSSVMT